MKITDAEKFSLNQISLIALTSLFFVIFSNISFYQNFLTSYGSSNNYIHLLTIFIVLFSLICLIFTIFSSKYTIKPILIIALLASSFASYFMDSYNVIIDNDMIRNVVQTDAKESFDLISVKLILYVLFLGIAPSFLIYKAKITHKSWRSELFGKLKFIAILLIVILSILVTFSKFYTSFFREYKPLRYYTNPTYWIYSAGSFVFESSVSTPDSLKEIGKDAIIEKSGQNQDKGKLVIMVVGETARADRFSLNGYEKETNPELKKEKNIVTFREMYSCGTSTAISVPCMFSIFDRSDYSYKKSSSTKNVLDVLSNTQKVAILWRDNNSDSKGVATRVDFQDYKSSQNNTICDETECRDEGMLVGLDEYIANHPKKDILIILHQMGNHGPAYYKRYPKKFEKFTPTCKTSQLDKCTSQEIGNAYDNSILYTDYFLAKTIDFLKPYAKTHKTAMFYISDHGESLGEKNLYLHGLPYFIAPDTQKHVASIMWLGSMEENIDYKKLKSYENNDLSHDNIFSTLLGLFEVKTSIYDGKKDITKPARKSQ